MNIQFISNTWFEVSRDTNGDILIGTADGNGNYIEIVIKKENKNVFETLKEDLEDI